MVQECEEEVEGMVDMNGVAEYEDEDAHCTEGVEDELVRLDLFFSDKEASIQEHQTIADDIVPQIESIDNTIKEAQEEKQQNKRGPKPHFLSINSAIHEWDKSEEKKVEIKNQQRASLEVMQTLNWTVGGVYHKLHAGNNALKKAFGSSKPKSFKPRLAAVKSLLTLIGGTIARFVRLLLRDEDVQKIVRELFVPKLQEVEKAYSRLIVDHKNLLIDLKKIAKLQRKDAHYFFKLDSISISNYTKIRELQVETVKSVNSKLWYLCLPSVKTCYNSLEANSVSSMTIPEVEKELREKKLSIEEAVLYPSVGVLDRETKVVTLIGKRGNYKVDHCEAHRVVANFLEKEKQSQKEMQGFQENILRVFLSGKGEPTKESLNGSLVCDRQVMIKVVTKLTQADVIIIRDKCMKINSKISTAFHAGFVPVVKGSFTGDLQFQPKDKLIVENSSFVVDPKYYALGWKRKERPVEMVLKSTKLHPIPLPQKELPMQVAALSVEVLVNKLLSILKSLIKFDEKSKEAHINLSIGADGLTCLNWPLYAFVLSLNVPSDYSKSGSFLQTKEFLFEIILTRGLKKLTPDMMLHVGQFLSPLLLREKIQLEGGSVVILLSLLKGDHHMLWEWMENKNGGHNRCARCAASFLDPLLFFFHVHSKLKSKTPLEILKAFFSRKLEEFASQEVDFTFTYSQSAAEKLAKEVAKDFPGIYAPPFFIVALFLAAVKEAKVKEFMEVLLPKLALGVDNLHNIRGWLQHLFNVLIQSKRFDSNTLSNVLWDLVKRRNINECNGEECRKIILNHEKILEALLVPKAGEDNLELKFTHTLQSLRIITMLAYTWIEPKDYPGLVLLMEVECFKLSLNAENLNQFPLSNTLMDLYLHTITSEYPKFFSNKCIMSGSTEKIEQKVRFTKQIMRNATNRSTEQSLREPLLRESLSLNKKFTESLPEHRHKHILIEAEGETNKKFERSYDILAAYKNPSLDWPAETDQTNAGKATRAFLTHLKNQPLFENLLEEQVVSTGKILVLKVEDNIHKYIDYRHKN